MVHATIDVIDRGRIKNDANYVVEGHTLGTQTNPNPDINFVEAPVLNFVIDHPEATILWDTGSHHDAGHGHWTEDTYDAFYHYNADEHRLDDDLEDAGYSLNDIDVVFQSHLHLDHAGGLEFFDGTDVPIFVHEEELKFAYYSAQTPEKYGFPGYVLKDFNHDLNWKIIKRKRETHFTGIEFVHLPGHSPGFMGTVIHLDDPGTIIIAGDQSYVAENYKEETPLGANLLWDSGNWKSSLQTVKELERRHDAEEVVFGHDLEQFHEIRDGWP